MRYNHEQERKEVPLRVSLKCPSSFINRKHINSKDKLSLNKGIRMMSNHITSERILSEKDF